MTKDLADEYLRKALHHARLAEKFAVAFLIDGADTMDEIKFHGNARDKYRQQAYAMTSAREQWARPSDRAWND